MFLGALFLYISVYSKTLAELKTQYNGSPAVMNQNGHASCNPIQALKSQPTQSLNWCREQTKNIHENFIHIYADRSEKLLNRLHSGLEQANIGELQGGKNGASNTASSVILKKELHKKIDSVVANWIQEDSKKHGLDFTKNKEEKSTLDIIVHDAHIAKNTKTVAGAVKSGAEILGITKAEQSAALTANVMQNLTKLSLVKGLSKAGQSATLYVNAKVAAAASTTVGKAAVQLSTTKLALGAFTVAKSANLASTLWLITSPLRGASTRYQDDFMDALTENPAMTLDFANYQPTGNHSLYVKKSLEACGFPPAKNESDHIGKSRYGEAAACLGLLCADLGRMKLINSRFNPENYEKYYPKIAKFINEDLMKQETEIRNAVRDQVYRKSISDKIHVNPMGQPVVFKEIEFHKTMKEGMYIPAAESTGTRSIDNPIRGN